LFEDLVIGATVADLIADDYLVDCDIYAPSEPDMKGVRSSKSIDGETDFRQSDLAKAVDKPSLIGDIRDHWFRLARGKQTAVFATDIAHSKHIVETFQAADVTAEHIDYRMTDDERAAILERFANGATTVLSNCALLSEGWDCPTAEVMVLARPTRSLIRYIQMAGRVLRPAPGKERALLLDHSGSTARLGHPCDDLPLALDDGKPRTSGSKSTERRESLPTKVREMQPHEASENPQVPGLRIRSRAAERSPNHRRQAGQAGAQEAGDQGRQAARLFAAPVSSAKAGLSSRLGGEPVPDLL
jgi:DNA repair protein RadD